MWLELLEFCFFSFLIMQFVRLVLADADLTLLWKEKFGKKPAVLRGDVVWISGASSGIGEYLTYELAKAGCKLILSARREDKLNRIKQTCISQGWTKEGDIMVLPLDLVAIDTHADAVDNVLKTFSNIDILVNNSGRGSQGFASKTDLSVDRDIMETNYFGTLSLTRAVLPHMLKRKHGHIMVTSSLAGIFASPTFATYCGSKFALQGWFDSLRLEAIVDNVHVTVVSPGPVASEISQKMLAEKKGETLALQMDTLKTKLMPTERCAELMAIALANKLDDVWISDNPSLLVVYMAQYMPTITKLISKRFGMTILRKLGPKSTKKTT